MGFYKKDIDTILTGENFVFSPIVTLTKETKDDYTYPQDGWYWFDTFDEALSFFAASSSSLSITPLQAKLQLYEIGLLDEVEALLLLDKKAKLYWDNAQKFYRDDTILLSMAGALGLSDEQLDDLFTNASKL